MTLREKLAQALRDAKPVSFGPDHDDVAYGAVLAQWEVDCRRVAAVLTRPGTVNQDYVEFSRACGVEPPQDKEEKLIEDLVAAFTR